MSQQNQTTDDLRTFLGKKLSYEKFKNLTNLLSISSTKLTRVFNNPEEEGTMEIVMDLAKLLQIPAYDLVKNYGLAQKNISDWDMSNHEELQQGYIIAA